MSSNEDDTAVTFLQYVADSGLTAYDRLVVLNTSDAEHKHQDCDERNETGWAHLDGKNEKKRKQETASTRSETLAPSSQGQQPSGTALSVKETSGTRSLQSVAVRTLLFEDVLRQGRLGRHRSPPVRLVGEDVELGSDSSYAGKHFCMGFVTMPAPPDRAALPHGAGFAVRSQSLHSVGGSEEDGSPTARKQPPPKPKRDPNTKLSASSETVDVGLSSGVAGSDPDKVDAWPIAAFAAERGLYEGCWAEPRRRQQYESSYRVPPPKPKRNPNTQLSTSFDESYIRNVGAGKWCEGSPKEKASSQTQSPTHDSGREEPVYIEMVGNILRDLQRSREEPSEAVYEEMKYPAFDDLGQDSKWEHQSCSSQCPTPTIPDVELTRASTPHGSLCDIPSPFPNLLSHRPPLLVFPPVPAQCSPNSDESPLTPLEVTKLPALDNVSYVKPGTEREPPATHTITASGRSSAPPLPSSLYKSSAHGVLTGAGMPRSASAVPHGTKGTSQEGSKLSSSSSTHGSMQNISRSRTPTSPLDELTNLFTTGRNMLKKSSSGRKSKEPAESEAKGRCHSSEPPTKQEVKDKSSHGSESRRGSKDKESHASESRRGSKDKSRDDPDGRHDSKDRASYGTDCRRDSKDKSCFAMEALPRRGSKDKNCPSVELLPRQDSKEKSSHAGAMKDFSRTHEWDGVCEQTAAATHTATPSRLAHFSVSPTKMPGNNCAGENQTDPMCSFASRRVTLVHRAYGGGRVQSSGPNPALFLQNSRPKGVVQPPCQVRLAPRKAPRDRRLSFSTASTMLETIEKKRLLCKEIKARQRAEKGLRKQESAPVPSPDPALPSWRRSNGTKRCSPPPYPPPAAVLWDTAI
ncbi:neuronal tyrosine-phosphorylated phosphoinositide-3-kinase adapter 2-like [Scleropages formosus]|uniref:Neuronal tyrosine-phosphorylated phosphoinositide-3-kinase adapter 2-like n=1 Tax=Scleropages formosus TaxID=113540 RepID=A0A0P7UGS0_SCLFO|nr:neuronal tyrosine-phosphorylated phosphoinositide-3-kinase adapter 2-like [Scleropages formosus]